MTTNIFVFGASITYGAWDIEKGGWVQRLRSYLEENYELQRYFIYNLGVPGDTSAMLLARFETDIKYRIEKGETNIVIFSIGVNDSSFLQNENKQMTELGTFKQNLGNLFNMASKYANKILFVGLTSVDEPKVSPILWNTDIFYSNDKILQYNNTIKDACQENGVLFIDLYDKIDKDFLVDGLHPNAKGHEKIFQIVKENLIKNKII